MSLQVLVNGFDITNGITHRINWVETTGLFDPAALVDPEAVDTFEGPYRVRQTTTDYGLREVSISGILVVAASDYASKLRALDSLQAIYAPRPSRVVVGTLELSVDFGRVQVAADQLKRLNGMIKYTVTGTAIPATFACTYGGGTGLVQGIPVDTQRVNEAAITASMASGVGTITNPGDVPTPAVLTIQGAASTVYYLATSATGRRVPISTDANGVGRLDERAGLYLAPGVNRITAYSAATGTTTLTSITVMSFFGTTWRYSGNAVAGNATRFDLGPALTVNRTGSARVFRGNTNPALNGTDGIVTAGDDEPRIGWVWQNRRNLITPSQDLFNAAWATSNVTRTSGGAVEPFGFTGPGGVVTLNDTTTGALGHSQYSMGSLSAISYVASVYILKDSVTSRQAGFTMNTTGGFAGAILNTSTGVASRSVDSSGTLASATVTVSDAGLWWKLAITWTGEAANNWRLTPALSTNGANTGGSPTGSAVFACPQVEIGTTPTAYQATDASGISLDHPVNDSGLVLEGTATNLCLQSEAFSTTWTVPVGSSITLDAAVSPAGTQTADRLTSSGLSPTSEQTITVAASTTYTFSCWVKAVSGTVTAVLTWENASTAAVYATTSATVGTNWTRLTATGSTPGGVTSIKVRVQEFTTNSIDVWGAQFEAGTAASSYIPTTTASVTRLAETAGLVSPHNLALYSDTQTNSAWAVTGWSVASTPVAGPVSSLLNAYRVTTTSTSADNLRQAVTIAGGQAGGKVYTFSVWLRQQATTASVVLHIENQAGTSRANLTATLTSTWQRYLVTATMASTDTDIIVKIRTANAAGTIDVFGAQLTEGYLPGRYVRTTDTNVLPVSTIDPSWSQNGYIEADFQWTPRPTGIGIVFGEGTVSSGSAAVGGLGFQTDITGPWTVFFRFDSNGTKHNVLLTSSTVHNRGYARLRGEWTNYLLGGNRFMLLRLYVDGVLSQEINRAGSSGSAWPLVDVTRFFRSNAALGVVSNLVIGTPSLPEGATAAGI